MNRTVRIIVATSVALAVAVPAFAGTASAAPPESTTTSTTITIRSGDSLAGLAWRHGVSLSAILRANSLELTSMIHPGDKLVIPAGASTASIGRRTSASSTAATSSRSAGGSDHVVAAGDALSLIALRHGVRLSALLEANDIELTSLILPGQRLRIPAASGQVSNRSAAGRAAASPQTNATSNARTTSSTGAGFDYVVRAGDALSLIAWRHGVRLSALLEANGISATSLIMPGRRLRIPSAIRSVPTSNRTQSAAPAGASSVNKMLSYATAQVGAPYRFFSAGPKTFDCSGLVVAAFRQIGINVPHQSRALAKLGRSIDWRRAPISAGDLVFTSATNDPDMITHVGIALNSQRWIHAVGHGKTVTIGSLPSDSKIMAVQRIAMP